MVFHRTRQRTCLVGAAILGVAMAPLCGCGGESPTGPSTRLEGAVTLDGGAIAAGTVNFIPRAKGQAQAVSADIVDGRYVAEAVPLGKVLVRIKATKETGKIIEIPHSDEKYPETVNIIPPKYAQGIPIEVAAEGGTRDFELTSD